MNVINVHGEKVKIVKIVCIFSLQDARKHWRSYISH